MKKTAACVFALLLCTSAPLLAWDYTFDDDGISGVLSRGDGDLMTTECHMLVDRSPDAVVAALTDYDRIGDWLPSTTEYRVLRRDGAGARFYRRNSTPFFVPEMWANVDATVQPLGDGKTHVEWHRVEGTVKVFDASFDVEPAGQGAKVTYRVKTAVELPVPAFILKRAGSKAIVETLQSLRAAARARK